MQAPEAAGEKRSVQQQQSAELRPVLTEFMNKHVLSLNDYLLEDLDGKTRIMSVMAPAEE